MIIRMEDLQDCCSKILAAVDANSLSTLTETLEIKVENQYVYVSVTNKEYFARVKLYIGDCENFRATVKANLFLKLVAQTTTDTIELSIEGNNLLMKGNGTYKLPLIFEGEDLLQLPEIQINNVTSEFDIKSSILHSLIRYNSKELTKGVPSKPVQRMYYVDEQGCITFTLGACVNNFTLDKPIKILLNDRLVKLFKLFKTDEVHFVLGYDSVSDDIIQTKVRFENDSICITAILTCDDTLLASVPVKSIRERAYNDYSHTAVIDKDTLLRAITRLLLFSDAKALKIYNSFEFTKDSVTIWDCDHNNFETVTYDNSIDTIQDKYECIFDLIDLKATLDSSIQKSINLRFGDGQAAVLVMDNVYTVIAECHPQ